MSKVRLSRRQFLHGAGMGSAALVLASCAQPAPAQAPAATAAPAKAADPTKAAVAATEPPAPAKPAAVAGGGSFTYWVGLNGNVGATLKTYNEILAYKEIEKITGVKIEFQHPPAGQETEQFNLMLASGKYPDMIEWTWLRVPGGPAKAIKDGIIIRLNEAIEKDGPNLTKWLTDHPDWRKQMITDEADIYVFPFFRSHPHLMTYAGPQIRQDWLDKLSMNVPTTMDEWHDMLVAFKSKDPNPAASEIPFSPAINASKLGAFDNHAFVGAYGITTGFYQDQGAVKYGPTQPQFKDFLQQMAGWYKEGLVDPDFPAVDQKAMDAKITGGQLGSYVHLLGSGMGRILGLMAKDTNFKLVGAPYPVLQAGQTPELGQRDFNYPGNISAAITTSCKRVKEAAQWLDFKYSEAGHMLCNFGIEGVSYTMVNGYPTYTEAITKNPEGLPMAQSMAQHTFANFGGPFVQDVRYMDQYVPLPAQQDALKTWTKPTNSKLLPNVTPTADESKKFATVMNDVNTRYAEAVIKIISGAESVDSWDNVLQQFKQMGIEDALTIQQAALERFNKRAG